MPGTNGAILDAAERPWRSCPPALARRVPGHYVVRNWDGRRLMNVEMLISVPGGSSPSAYWVKGDALPLTRVNGAWQPVPPPNTASIDDNSDEAQLSRESRAMARWSGGDRSRLPQTTETRTVAPRPPSRALPAGAPARIYASSERAGAGRAGTAIDPILAAYAGFAASPGSTLLDVKA